jgi:hypothetical protein
MILTGLCTIASAVDQKGTVTGRVDTVNDVEIVHGSSANWSEAALSAHGETLQAKYTAMFAELKKELFAAVPAVDEQKKTAFDNAHAAVQAGDEAYSEWYPKIRDALVKQQNAQGGWTRDAPPGTISYETPMAIIILATPHRYIPIYQR